jgi:hypothetical protein
MAIKTQLPADPEGMNDDRAKWAMKPLFAFMKETGVDPEDAISDLVADLMHYCDRHQEHGDGLEQVNRGIRSYMDDCLEWDKQSGAQPVIIKLGPGGTVPALTDDQRTIDGRNRAKLEV